MSDVLFIGVSDNKLEQLCRIFNIKYDGDMRSKLIKNNIGPALIELIQKYEFILYMTIDFHKNQTDKIHICMSNVEPLANLDKSIGIKTNYCTNGICFGELSTVPNTRISCNFKKIKSIDKYEKNMWFKNI